jgi:Lrp/AsnC family leucine-responsive transcriptional regulator
MKIDESERGILGALQEDGRMTNAQLAARVGLSESPCFRRVKRLEQQGLIRRYSALVDRRRLGLEVMAFVEVTMERQPDAATEKFLARVRAEAHIIECHAMSGSHDYLMKVVARNIDHFSELCMKRILKFPGVSHVQSSFSLDEVKIDAAVPT